jgi:hypothetical protein
VKTKSYEIEFLIENEELVIIVGRFGPIGLMNYVESAFKKGIWTSNGVYYYPANRLLEAKVRELSS